MRTPRAVTAGLLAGLLSFLPSEAPARGPAPPAPAGAGSAPVAPARPPSGLAFEELVLANGLRVLLLEDHAVPKVAAVTWFRVGSRDEEPGRTGFAHLFEHLMFKGSKHVADGVMDELLEEAGGWSNAFTSSDMTVYQSVASSNFLETVLWLEADRLAGLLDTFDQAKLDNQRDVVRNERRQHYDNRPYGMAEILLQEALWPAGHGYHWSTIGYHEDLVAASVDDVRRFFERFYVPRNATLVVAGDFEPARARALVERYLGWLPAGGDPRRPAYPTPPPIAKEVRLTAEDQVQVPRVYVAWRGPTSYAPDEAPLDLAAAILGDGKSSRLYERLVYRDRLAQDVEVSFTGETLGGTFLVVATAKPGVDPEALIRAALEEVDRLAAVAPPEREVAKARNSWEAAFLGGLEDVVDRAIQLAWYDVQAGDPGFVARDLARYRAVTPRAVQAATRRWLRPEARVVLTIRPEEVKP